LSDSSRTNVQITSNLIGQTRIQETHSKPGENTSVPSNDYATEVRTLTTCALLAALGVSSSTALLIVPNVEMMMIVIFIAGYRYGLRAGVSTAIIATILFEMIASAFFGWLPLVTLAKLPAYLLATIIGSILGRADRPLVEPKNGQLDSLQRTSILFGIIGLLLTLAYDLLTTLAFGISTVGFNLRGLALIYFLGMPFTILHEISNFIVFFWFPTIMKAMDNIEGTRRAGR
jgi:hypothetical protein